MAVGTAVIRMEGSVDELLILSERHLLNLKKDGCACRAYHLVHCAEEEQVSVIESMRLQMQ